MTGKNYTNPADRGRFGFKESGTFNSGFRSAHVFSALLIAGVIVLAAILCFFVINFMRTNMGQIANSGMLWSLAGGVSVIFIVGVAAVIIGVGLKIINGGYKCKYAANEEKFTITTGSEVHTIYYKDVQKVHFLPIMRGGAVCGYNVTVQINGACEEYSIVFDGFLSEKNTPFYIIKERMEIIRRAEDEERARQREQNAVGDSSKPILLDEIALAQSGKRNVYDRMAELLGKDAEMPGVSLAKNAPPADDERLQRVMEKVSPSIEGYASDMPSVGLNGKTAEVRETYLSAVDGREVSADDIQGQGTFNVAASRRRSTVMFIAAFGIVPLLMVLWAKNIFSLDIMSNTILCIAAIIIGPGTILNYLRHGTECRYKANGREFVVYAKNKPEEHIYYKDVISVSYKPFDFLFRQNGYEVSIETKYGTVKYKYVFPGFIKHISEQDLPFEIIRRNIAVN